MASRCKIDSAQHIAVCVELRVGHRGVKVDLRGEVEDDVMARTPTMSISSGA